MEIPNNSLQRAFRDLSEIRNAIARAEGQIPGSPYAYSLNELHLKLHIALIVITICLLGREWLFKPSLTDALYFSYNSEPLRILGIVAMAAFLVILTIVLYYVIWRAAQKSEENFEDYIARHFIYLRNLSFVSDLFVKFTVLSVIILARRPDWVAPILLIFTGDYLFQGRLFILHYRVAVALGALCTAMGIWQLIFMEGNLVYPLFGFLFVCVTSLVHILRLRGKNNSMEI